MLFAFFKKIKKDADYRIKLFLFLSLVFNFVYAIFLFIIGRRYLSKWFLVLSVYYGLLSLVRIFIFRRINHKKQLFVKIKTMRVCGYFLLLINIAVSSMTFILIRENYSVQHHEITVITLATYTFSTLTLAIVNSIKYLRKNDYVYSCVKSISLISASVSLVTLTSTMLSTFGEDNALLRSIIMPILSTVVAVFIIVSAIFMIRKSNLALRNLKNEKERK